MTEKKYRVEVVSDEGKESTSFAFRSINEALKAAQTVVEAEVSSGKQKTGSLRGEGEVKFWTYDSSYLSRSGHVSVQRWQDPPGQWETVG